MADTGMLTTERVRIKTRPLEALEKAFAPDAHKTVQNTRAAVCKPYPAQYPGGKLGLRLSLMQSMKPTMFKAALRTWARKKSNPMEPPNSGPREREMR